MTKQNVSPVRVGIIGGTGYTAMELLRLLLPHPKVSVHCVTSRAEAGVSVVDYFPNLRGLTDLKFSPPEGGALDDCQVVFFSTPHGTAMKGASALLSKGIKVIDLSADFRLTDVQVWKRWYGMDHSAPELLKVAVYGLAELHRKKITQAKLVANPGCYSTATLLGLLPLVQSGAVALDGLIVDAKSGVTGAGRKAETDLLLAEAADSFKAYAVKGHRHHPEILEQVMSYVACASPAVSQKVTFTFVPHLIPMIRGMHITLYGRILKHMDFQELYESFYTKEPFVDVMPSGSHPTTRSVRASNLCRLAIHRPGDGDTLVVLSVIDNLTKGASGQAVQNMNLMMGWPETLGLMAPPATP